LSVAAGDVRTSLLQVPGDRQVYHCQASPPTGVVGGPSSDTGTLLGYDEAADELPGDRLLAHGRHYAAVDEYSSTCKDEIRSYVDLMTSGTVLLH